MAWYADLPTGNTYFRGSTRNNSPILLRSRSTHGLQVWHRRAENYTVFPWCRLGAHPRTTGRHSSRSSIYRWHIQFWWFPRCFIGNSYVYTVCPIIANHALTFNSNFIFPQHQHHYRRKVKCLKIGFSSITHSNDSKDSRNEVHLQKNRIFVANHASLSVNTFVILHFRQFSIFQQICLSIFNCV